MFSLVNNNRVNTKPNRGEILRLKWTSGGAITISNTNIVSNSEYKWIDNKGEIFNTTYSRTVQKNDWLILHSFRKDLFTKLNFNSRNIIGNLPDFTLMPSLTYIDFGNNNSLKCLLPDISNLINLTFFNISATSIYGVLPNFDKLLLLEAVYAGAKLSGCIPDISNNINLLNFWVNGNILTGNIPDLSKNTKIISFQCFNNLLTGYVSSIIPNTLGTFNALNNLLDQSSVDAILNDFVAAGRNSGTRVLNLGGTGNSAPSQAGLNNVAILQSRGWTVTVNV